MLTIYLFKTQSWSEVSIYILYIESHPRQLIFLRKSDYLGCAVLLCLVVWLASFFLPYHRSLKHVHVYTCKYTCTLYCTCAMWTGRGRGRSSETNISPLRKHCTNAHKNVLTVTLHTVHNHKGCGVYHNICKQCERQLSKCGIQRR